jgi:hypothetical protein
LSVSRSRARAHAIKAKAPALTGAIANQLIFNQLNSLTGVYIMQHIITIIESIAYNQYLIPSAIAALLLVFNALTKKANHPTGLIDKSFVGACFIGAIFFLSGAI